MNSAKMDRLQLDSRYAIVIALLEEEANTRPSRGDIAVVPRAAAFSIRSLKAGSLRQQCQSLLLIHGLPRYKFLRKHILSAKESQLEE